MTEHSGYQKTFGTFSATMIIAGSMIGSGIFIVPAGVIIRSLFNYKLELAQPVPPKSAAPKKGKAGAPPKDAQDATGAAEKAATAGAAHEARHSTGAPHAAHHAAPSHAAAHHAAEKHAASEHPSH